MWIMFPVVFGHSRVAIRDRIYNTPLCNKIVSVCLRIVDEA